MPEFSANKIIIRNRLSSSIAGKIIMASKWNLFVVTHPLTQTHMRLKLRAKYECVSDKFGVHVVAENLLLINFSLDIMLLNFHPQDMWRVARHSKRLIYKYACHILFY